MNHHYYYVNFYILKIFQKKSLNIFSNYAISVKIIIFNCFYATFK